MSPTSVTFLLFVAVCLGVFHACPTARARRWVVAGANIVFLGSFATSPASLLPLVAFLATGYVGLLVVKRRPSSSATGAAIAVLLIAFVWLRRYAFASFLPPLPFAYTTVGLSYVLFRMIHLIVDTRSGPIAAESVTPRAFLNYTCNFLCFVSGPIQRFQEHAEQERHLGERALDPGAMLSATARVVRGYAKLLIVSEVLRLGRNHAHEALARSPGAWAPIIIAAALISELLQWYYNFAGLMDVMIGLGQFFGLRLPENFDRPFAARNFLELWTRWHITLSEWFRDYVFTPLAQALVRRWSSKGQVTAIGIVCYFVTFLLLGAWHGPTTGWLGVGLMLGLGVSANKAFEALLRARLGRRRLATLRARPFYATLCRGCTLLYFALAMGMTWLSGAEARQLLTCWTSAGAAGTGAAAAGAAGPAMGTAGAVGALHLLWALPALGALFLAMGGLVGVVQALGDRAMQSLAGLWRGVAERPALGQAVLGVAAFVVLLLLLDQSFAPQFVYMNF